MKNYILIDPTKINEEDQSLNEALPSPPPPPPRKPRRKPSAPAASAPQAGTQGAGGGTQGAGGGTQGTGNGRPSVPTPGVPGQTKEDEDPWYIWLLESMGITAEDHTMLFNIVGEMAQRLLDGIFGFSQDELERLYIAIIEGDLEEAYKQLRPNIIDVAHWAKEKMKVTLGGGEGEYTQEELDEWEFWIDGLALLICTGFAMNLARASALSAVVDRTRAIYGDDGVDKDTLKKIIATWESQTALGKISKITSLAWTENRLGADVVNMLEKLGHTVDSDGNVKFTGDLKNPTRPGMGGAILDAGEGAIDKLIGGDFFTPKNIALRGTLGAIPLMGKNIFAAFMRRGLDEALAGNFLRDFASEVDEDMTPKELKKLRSANVDEFVNMLDLQKDKIKDNLDALKVEKAKLKKQMDVPQTPDEVAETQKQLRKNKKAKKHMLTRIKKLDALKRRIDRSIREKVSKGLADGYNKGKAWWRKRQLELQKTTASQMGQAAHIALEEIVGGDAGVKFKVIPGEGGWAIGSPENRTVYGPDISPEQKKKFNDEIKAWVDKSSERKRAIAKAKFRRFISNKKQKINQLWANLKTRVGRKGMNESNESGAQSDLIKKLEPLKTSVDDMMTKFEADNDKLDRELSVASKKYMKLQKEFLRQITQDIDDLAKEATSELMSSIDSTPNFNLQERKIRVSKEELVSLISEQIKNDTRTHRVNKHHLIELIAEETNKQVSRKK